MVVHSGVPAGVWNGCLTGLPQALEVGSCLATRGMLWLADNSRRAFLLGLTKGKEPFASRLTLPLYIARETGLLGAG